MEVPMRFLTKRYATRLFFLLFLVQSSLLHQGLLGQSSLGESEKGDSVREARVDEAMEEFDDTHSPGCSVGVMTEEGVVFAKGYGMANLDHRLAITPRTVFRTGSVSKQFTAAVVTFLSEEGAFSLDDGIRAHFSELPEAYDGVTVRHLLHHTSGIRDYLELMGMRGIGDEATYTEDDVVELLARQQDLNFPPGSAHRYSNSGYLLLSRLVFRTTGKTLRDQAHRLLFEPLGMVSTHFHDDHREIVPERASGYDSGRDGSFFLSQTTLDIVGDGGVFTSLEDLSLWMANFWSLDVGDASWLGKMETRGVLNTGDTLSYAFGLTHSVHRGLPTVGHGGAFVGYRAATLRYPSEEVGVMALCNYARAAPTEIVRKVGEIWFEDRMEPLPEDRSDPETPGSTRRASEEDPPIPQLDPRPLLGEYHSEELDATYRIVLEGEDLLLDVNGGFTTPLEAGGSNSLRAGWLTLTYELRGGLVTQFRVGSGRAGGILFVRK